MLTASVMSAPAALLCSKINMPEEEGGQKLPVDSKRKNSKIEIKDNRFAWTSTNLSWNYWSLRSLLLSYSIEWKILQCTSVISHMVRPVLLNLFCWILVAQRLKGYLSYVQKWIPNSKTYFKIICEHCYIFNILNLFFNFPCHGSIIKEMEWCSDILFYAMLKLYTSLLFVSLCKSLFWTYHL